MTDKQQFWLSHSQARANALEAVKNAPEGFLVLISPPKRSEEQSRRMWAMLGEIADQVPWYGQKLSAEDYKDMMTASLKKARVVPGLDPGSFVVMGLRTSKMTKSEMSDLMMLIEAFGAEHDVVFSDPAYSQYEAAQTR